MKNEQIIGLLIVLFFSVLIGEKVNGQQVIVSATEFNPDAANTTSGFFSINHAVLTGVQGGGLEAGPVSYVSDPPKLLTQFRNQFNYLIAKNPSTIDPNYVSAPTDYMFIVTNNTGNQANVITYTVDNLVPNSPVSVKMTYQNIIDPASPLAGPPKNCQYNNSYLTAIINPGNGQNGQPIGGNNAALGIGKSITATITGTADAGGKMIFKINTNSSQPCVDFGITSIEVTGSPQPSVMSRSGEQPCAGEQLIFEPQYPYAGTYQWFEDGNPIAGATNATLSVASSTNVSTHKYSYKVTVTNSGVTPNPVLTSSAASITTIKCCEGPNGSASSRATIYYDDFGTLTDMTGKNFRVWDYTTTRGKPYQKVVPATSDFRMSLPTAPIGTAFKPTGPITDYTYAIVANMTRAQLEWSNNILGYATGAPEIGYDRTGKATGGALLINVPDKLGPLYTRKFENLCVNNGDKIFFECYITVFTYEPTPVDITVTLNGGGTPITINVQANSAGYPDKPNAGIWVPIRAQVQLAPPYTLTMDISNNSANNTRGNDLVMDDIRIMACAPPSIDLVFNKNTLSLNEVLCKDQVLYSTPTPNFRTYYGNNLSYLYQWSTTPGDLASWKNLTTPQVQPGGESYNIPDVKGIDAANLTDGKKIYFRVVAGDPTTLSAGGEFNKDDPCRKYSISDTIVGTIQCPSCNQPTSVTATSTPALTAGPPKTVTICEGSTATLTGAYVVGTKAPNPLNSYKFSWYKKGTTPAPAALGAAPTPIADKALLPADSGTWVLRVEDSDASGTPASPACYLEDSIKLVVLKRITDNLIESDQTICSGSSADSLIQKKGTTIKGSIASPGFKWVSSTTKESGYVDAGSSESFYFKTTGINATTYFKRIALAQAGLCPNDSSLPVTITVVPPITDNKINSDTLICGGNAPAIKGSAVANQTLYIWQDSSATTGKWTDIPNSNTKDLPTGRTLINTDPAKNVFSYYRRIAKVGTCMSISNTITVTVTAGIDPGKIGTSQVICSGATPVKLTNLATAVGGSVSPIQYIWLTSADGVTYTEEGTANAASTEYTFANPLTANLFLKRRAIGGPNVCDAGNTEPVQITVVKPPVANIIAPRTITSPDSASETYNELPKPITAKATDPGYKGVWAIISTVPSTPAVTLGSAATSIDNTIKEMAFDQKAVVTWTVTDSGKVCPAAIAKLTLERKNFTKASVQDKEMCVTTLPVPYVLNGNGLIGDETSTWTYLGSTPEVSTKPTIAVDPVDPTNILVTGFEIPPNAGKVKFNFLYAVVSTLGGNTQDTATITVWEKSQEANITPATEETCKDNIALTGTKPLQPEAKGIWKVNSGADISQFSDVNVNTATLKRVAEPKEKYLLGGTVSLTWTITNGMCPPTEKIGTYVFRPTQKVEAQIIGDSVLCLPKDSSTFTASTANGGPLSRYAFEVTHADGTKGKAQASSAATTFNINPNELKDQDKITVSIEPDTAAGCFVGLGSATIGIDGYVYPDTLLLPGDDTACVGEKVRICLANQTKVKGWESYQWYKGITAVPSETKECIELQNPEQSGDYVLVTHTTQCGPHASVVRPVKIYHKPEVSFDPDEMVFALVDLDSTVVLQPIIKNTPLDSLYLQKWSKVSGKELAKDPVLPLSAGDKDTLSPIFKSPANGGTFIYSLKTSTFDNAKHHCADSAEVTVIALPSIRVPNIFSPNGDGSNDKWYIYGLENYAHAKVSVFNRLGNRLMEISPYTPESAWDGTMGGSGEVPVGTYYYVIDLIRSAGSLPRTYTGNVTIIR